MCLRLVFLELQFRARTSFLSFYGDDGMPPTVVMAELRVWNIWIHEAAILYKGCIKPRFIRALPHKSVLHFMQYTSDLQQFSPPFPIILIKDCFCHLCFGVESNTPNPTRLKLRTNLSATTGISVWRYIPHGEHGEVALSWEKSPPFSLDHYLLILLLFFSLSFGSRDIINSIPLDCVPLNWLQP